MSNKNSIPKYRKHRQSGQAIVTLPEGHGRRRDILLGEYGTAKSRQEYARVISEWEASGRCLAHADDGGNLTVSGSHRGEKGNFTAGLFVLAI